MNDAEWETLIAALRDPDDADRAVAATVALYTSAGVEDIPRLVELLRDDSFFVREAAAWPLSALGATSCLPHLLDALHRGTQEGHDNDSLCAALTGLAEANPQASRQELNRIIGDGPGYLREDAMWLLEFCPANQEDRREAAPDV